MYYICIYENTAKTPPHEHENLVITYYCKSNTMADLETIVMPRVINFLSSLLQRVADTNDVIISSSSQHNHHHHHHHHHHHLHQQQFYPQKVSVFHGLTRPTISIQSYLERIFKYANCSPSCFVVAYVYLDRFEQRQPSFPINSYNVHRLLITSVLVSAKFMDDIYYNNAYYAKVGGISTAEMNVLEVDFLFGLGFQLNVTPTTFHTYCSYLQREMLIQSPLQLVDPPLNMARPMIKIQQHCCFSEDESTHQKQLAAV